MARFNLPTEYKNYVYPAVGMMLGGIVVFIVSLFLFNEAMMFAGIGGIAFGFFLSFGLAFGTSKRDRKGKKFTYPVKVAIIAGYVAAIILIIDGIIIPLYPDVNITALLVIQWSIFAAVVIGLIIFFIFWERRKHIVEE